MQLLGLCNSDEDIQRLFWRSAYRVVLSSLLSLVLFPVIALAALNWPSLNPHLKQIHNIHSFRANKLSEALLLLLIARKSPSRLIGHGRREVVR